MKTATLAGIALVAVVAGAVLGTYRWASAVGNDVNNDGFVTIEDIFLVAGAFGQAVQAPIPQPHEAEISFVGTFLSVPPSNFFCGPQPSPTIDPKFTQTPTMTFTPTMTGTPTATRTPTPGGGQASAKTPGPTATPVPCNVYRTASWNRMGSFDVFIGFDADNYPTETRFALSSVASDTSGFIHCLRLREDGADPIVASELCTTSNDSLALRESAPFKLQGGPRVYHLEWIQLSGENITSATFFNVRLVARWLE